MTHQGYIQDWENRQRLLIAETPPHDQHNFDVYLQWLHRSTRTHIQAPYTNKAIDEEENKDDITNAYDNVTRMETQLQRAPPQRYMVRNLNFNTSARRRSYEL
jgi:ribosome-associated translation inhibitor RaiA